MTDILFPETQQSYKVLALRKRPQTLSELIGQEVLVQTLRNSFEKNRVAHAFLLTGDRGVGKTTTARIIAKGLNCIGEDGKGNAVADPCNKCTHCEQIANDRHLDVIEMDAASRTGVEDIRELIDGVKYKPSSGRSKVFILDEVHMLSKNAFNALLKNLEEPPPHVTFIFATTEVDKIPITILSRCMRFDLRRVEIAVLADYYASIAKAEKIAIDEDAIATIARVAGGSVRDGLSLLEQAASFAEANETISLKSVRSMIGLADSGKIYKLLQTLFSADVAAAIEQLNELYNASADPVHLLSDMLTTIHVATKISLAPNSVKLELTTDENENASKMAKMLSPAELSRAWAVLMKGWEEIMLAPHPMQSLEMTVIRLALIANQPLPAVLAKKLEAELANNAKVNHDSQSEKSTNNNSQPTNNLKEVVAEIPKDVSENASIEAALQHEGVKEVLETFPGAKVISVISDENNNKQ